MTSSTVLRWLQQMTRRLRSAWHFIRELSGDDAYERYLQHAGRAHPGVEPLTPAAFQAQREARKWSGVQRCC